MKNITLRLYTLARKVHAKALVAAATKADDASIAAEDALIALDAQRLKLETQFNLATKEATDAWAEVRNFTKGQA